jgi:hypothetical protein
MLDKQDVFKLSITRSQFPAGHQLHVNFVFSYYSGRAMSFQVLQSSNRLVVSILFNQCDQKFAYSRNPDEEEDY